MQTHTIGSYLPEDVEEHIAEALLLYAHQTSNPAVRELALEWHHALQNDTWLLQTTEDPR